MSPRNKGFDPLSSLFEAPDPSRGVPLEDLDPPRQGLENAPVELSDPLFKRPTNLPGDADLPENSLSDVEIPVVDPPQDREALARRLAQEALARARAAGSEPAPATEDKQALARKLAQEAMARAAAQSQAPTPSSQDKQALARQLAQEAMARAAAQAQAPAPSSQDKQALARKLAQEALARAQAAAAPPAARPAPAKPPAPPPAVGLPPKANRMKEQDSRVASLRERARKPMNALDAARAAARDEEERQAQALRKKATQLTDVVQELLPAWLPGIGAVYVANAIAVRDREVLVKLWKGHRARFLADGQLERAVGAAVVLAALDQVPEGHLVAAHAVTDASDYLVWLDLDKRALVAAFANARAYFAHAS